MSIKSTTPKCNDYDPSKKLSQQIAMTQANWNQFRRVSPFDEDSLDILNIFDCRSIRTARGIFSLTLYATPQMDSNRAWVKHEICFQAEEIFDSTFNRELLTTYSFDKVDEIFKKHFVSENPEECIIDVS